MQSKPIAPRLGNWGIGKIMATSITIVINSITHRLACTDGLGEAALVAYDASKAKFFANLKGAAEADGFGFEVDDHGQGSSSYRVIEADGSNAFWEETERANEFMQSPVADFWEMYA